MLSRIITSILATIGSIIALAVMGFVAFALLLPGTQVTQLHYTLTFLTMEGKPVTSGGHGVWAYSRITANNELILENHQELELDKKGSAHYDVSVSHAVTFLEAIILKTNLVKKPPFQLVLHDAKDKVYMVIMNKKNTQLVTYTKSSDGRYTTCVDEKFRVEESQMEQIGDGWNIRLTVTE